MARNTATAIGNVDIASAQSAADYIKPLAPVRSEGSLSATRSVNGVNVLLHTASISRGNSGGPVLDRCGRVLGVNSAITKGQDGDANFAFAISESELAAFLSQAKQPVGVVTNPCMSLEARLSAVIAELNHRVKNILAVIQSIVTRTIRPGVDIDSAR